MYTLHVITLIPQLLRNSLGWTGQEYLKIFEKVSDSNNNFRGIF